VRIGGETGKVSYIYTNGYTLVKFPNKVIQGGIFNNDSTFGNENIKHRCSESCEHAGCTLEQAQRCQGK
jgi:hypothetical protein